MSAIARRTSLAFVLVLLLLTTGAWQSNQVALAASQSAGGPETPLFPGLTWSDPAVATQDIRININGDSINLSGERQEALVKFPGRLPQEVLDYYSNRQLAKAGWASYDAFNGADGLHYVFYHESGVYLSVDFLQCADAPSSLCLSVWKSEQVQPAAVTPGAASEPGDNAAKVTWGKTSPANGATGLDPTDTTLSWESYPGADKYKYCIQSGSACENDDPDWTSTYSRSLTLRNLSYNVTYYWQIKATTCETCVPKPWVYADNDTPWHFRTRTGSGNQVTILGNAGVGGAVLSFNDGGARSVIADSSGAYLLRVSYNWTGTITPSKPGFVFYPPSASFTNLTATQTILNFIATGVYVISGNTSIPGVTLSYVDGTPRTVVSDANGNYSISVQGGWSGTVTPSRTGYVFAPASRTYSNVSANQTGQNYTATHQTFTISGNTGVGGVTLRYFIGGVPRTVTSDGSGNYSLAVLYGWVGTITPSKTGYIFSPTSRSFSNVLADQTGQNFTATPIVTISGSTGVSYTTLSYTYGTPRTITSQANGNYSFNVLGGWSGTVTPTHFCFTFTPSNRSYNNVGSSQANQNFTPALKAGCGEVNLQVHGVNQGRFGVPAHGSIRTSIRDLNNGPARIVGSNAIPLIAAERFILSFDNVNTSFSELMGLPNGQLDTIYWLPWYNNATMSTQLRIANVTGSSATVRLYIRGAEMTSGCSPSNSPYTLAPGATLRVTCAGISNGPVKIESTQSIVASERIIYVANGKPTSYSEMMALPNSQASTTYWLPWYNNVDLDTQLRVGNLSATQSATVHISIAGQEVNGSPFTVQAGASNVFSLAGINNGPVKIESNQNIVASERVIYKVNGLNASFSETMALSNSQVENTYWLPWYNNVNLGTQLRFANLNPTQSATVHVYIAGQEVNGSPFTLQAGASTRVSLAGANGGSVKIQSNQNLVVSARVLYNVDGTDTSYSELMALPNSQLDSVYWFPWYNNFDLDTQLRIAQP